MKVEILYPTSYAVAHVTLDKGEEVRAEAGALVSMDGNVEIKTEARGGFLKSLSRSVLGGESFFINTFVGGSGGSEIAFAPNLPGDVVVMQLNDQDLIVQSGSYLAGSAGIEVETKWGGARSFFAGEGLIMLRCQGTGSLVVSSYGAIHRLSLEPGRRYVVDTGHIVAFDSHLRYEIRKTGGWKTTVFGGEGLVSEFTGPGTLYIQTRSPESFLNWLVPKLPTNRE